MAAGTNTVHVGGRTLPLPVATVRRAVATVLAGERRRATISITFLGPLVMRRMNREHKNHDWPTDVLSFPLTGPGGDLVGDIYICGAVARRQAGHLQIPAREELIRLVIHGVLHVLGYAHPETAGREQSAMWQRQERYVARVENRRTPRPGVA